MDKPLLLIGLPVHGNINPAVVTSLLSLGSHLDIPCKIHLQSNCYVHDARNKIVAEALSMKATHLMFIDADMVFPSNGVNQLMKADKDIIGGIYYRRQPPHLPTINFTDGEKLYIPKTFPTNKPFKTYVVATGFMLIKTRVFEKLTPPYFFFGDYKGKAMGEDTYFCDKAHKAFIDVWCDPTIPLGHVGEEVYGVEHYNLYKDEQVEKIMTTFDGQL